MTQEMDSKTELERLKAERDLLFALLLKLVDHLVAGEGDLAREQLLAEVLPQLQRQAMERRECPAA